jgi:hypothetical protein
MTCGSPAREIAGYAMAAHMRADLISDAVELAHRRGLVRQNAIFDSDRGRRRRGRQGARMSCCGASPGDRRRRRFVRR